VAAPKTCPLPHAREQGLEGGGYHLHHLVSLRRHMLCTLKITVQLVVVVVAMDARGPNDAVC